jgi:malonate transporter and related proteins
MNTVLLLLPDLALIALGFVLMRFAGWDRPFWDGLERLVYFVLFPALLFNSILRTPISIAQSWPTLASVGGAILAGIVVSALAQPVLNPAPVQFASGVQCGFRFNTYVALALSQRLGGEAGLALCAIIAGFAVPIVNIAAVYALARHDGSRLWREVIRNPLVLATLGGLAGNAIGLQLPEPVNATITRLGTAALSAGLLTVGAGMIIGTVPIRSDTVSGNRLAVWLTLTKLALMPACAWLLAWKFDLAPLDRDIAVMFAAMPTASSCYILAARMKGDGPYVARLVTVSMLASLLTLPLWLSMVR